MGKKSSLVPRNEWQKRFEKELTRYKSEAIDRIWRNSNILNACGELVYTYLDTSTTEFFYKNRTQRAKARKADLQTALKGFEAAIGLAKKFNVQQDIMLLSNLYLKYSQLLANNEKLVDTQAYGRGRSLVPLYQCQQILRLHLRVNKIKPKIMSALLKAGYAAMGLKPGRDSNSASLERRIKRFTERKPTICQAAWQRLLSQRARIHFPPRPPKNST